MDKATKEEMMMGGKRKIGTVMVDMDVEAGGNRLEAGEYLVSMPADYDEHLVTGADILLDGQIELSHKVVR